MYYSEMANFHYFMVFWGKGTAFIGAIVIKRIPIAVPNWGGELNRVLSAGQFLWKLQGKTTFWNGSSSFF